MDDGPAYSDKLGKGLINVGASPGKLKLGRLLRVVGGATDED